MEQRDFFISYTSADKVWALWVYYVLTLYGKTAYIQEYDSPEGEDFQEWMMNAIDSSKNFIFIWSRAYSEDGYYAMQELKHAGTNKKNHRIGIFLPIRVDSCPKPREYDTIHYINLSELNECDAIKKLCKAIRCTAIEPVSFPGAERKYADNLRKLESDYADNLCKLGEFYSDGIFPVKVSIGKANSLFENAAKKGNAAAYHHIGKLRELDGFLEEAYENYQKAANGGYKFAYIELGRLCRTGFENKEPDYDKALEYYNQANLSGNPEVMFARGFFHEHGYAGFQKDDTCACRYYMRAKKSGSREAELYLSAFYKDGRGGLPKDMREAMQCLRHVCETDIDDNLSRQADLLLSNMDMDFQEAKENYPKDMECLCIIRKISSADVYVNLSGTYFDGFWKKADNKTYHIGDEVLLKVKGYNNGDCLIVLEALP